MRKIPGDIWQGFQSEMTVLSLKIWIIPAVSFKKLNRLFSLFFLPLPHLSFSPFSHYLLSCAPFFPGPTSSEAITLAAARQWPEISKEPGQAASTAGKAAPPSNLLSPSIIHAPPKRRFHLFHKCVWFSTAILGPAIGILKLGEPVPRRLSVNIDTRKTQQRQISERKVLSVGQLSIFKNTFYLSVRLLKPFDAYCPITVVCFSSTLHP